MNLIGCLHQYCGYAHGARERKASTVSPWSISNPKCGTNQMKNMTYFALEEYRLILLDHFCFRKRCEVKLEVPVSAISSRISLEENRAFCRFSNFWRSPLQYISFSTFDMGMKNINSNCPLSQGRLPTLKHIIAVMVSYSSTNFKWIKSVLQKIHANKLFAIIWFESEAGNNCVQY